MEDKLNKAKEILKKYNQEHILNGYDNLDENKKQVLLNQIFDTDFELIKSLYANTKKQLDNNDDKIEPMDYMDKFKLNEKYKYYENIGKDAIKQGKLAAVTMAGGQGTRLGHKGPKGTFKVIVNNEEKYLFQIIVESLQEANNKYNVIIPWYIMTSEDNDFQTKNFFEINDYFEYPKEMIKFLRSIKTGKYNAYLDDLIDFALCTEEDIQTIAHYIYELEIKLYDLLNDGEYFE